MDLTPDLKWWTVADRPVTAIAGHRGNFQYLLFICRRKVRIVSAFTGVALIGIALTEFTEQQITMIRHIVLTRFNPSVSEQAIAGIYGKLERVVERMEHASGFTGGRSKSPEQIERGYLHGFVIDFDSWEALAEYAEDPEHKRCGAMLVENAQGGIDGILVLDLEV